jgi:hypothetical protein
MAQAELYHVGIVLNGPAGALQRYLGIVVSHGADGKTILAITAQDTEGGRRLFEVLDAEGEKRQITFIKTETQNLIYNVSEAWPAEVTTLREVSREAVLKAYYQGEAVPAEVGSETMLSAQSETEKDKATRRRSASFAPGAAASSSAWPQMTFGRGRAQKNKADDDDEDSDDVEPQMNELAEQMRKMWGRGPFAQQPGAPSGTGFEAAFANSSRPSFKPTGVAEHGPGSFMAGAAASSGPPGGAAGYAGLGPTWTAAAQQNAASMWGQPPYAAQAAWAPPGSACAGGAGAWHPGAAAPRSWGMPAAPSQGPPWMAPGAPPPAAAAAANGGGTWEQQQQQMMMMMFMNMMRKDKEDEDSGATAKAYRKMAKVKQRFEAQPDEVIQDYCNEVMSKLGASPGDAWRLWHYTEKIQFKQMLGLKRIHWHLSRALEYGLAGNQKAHQAYCVQILRGIHQSVLDGGGWENASLILPGEDPCSRDRFGATEAELQAIASYKDAQRRILGKSAGRGKGGETEGDNAADAAPKGGHSKKK